MPGDVGADTNVLLASVRGVEPFRSQALAAIGRLRSRGDRIVFFPHVVAEYWGVCTRPATARGGLGLSVSDVAQAVEALEEEFDLLPDRPEAYALWKDLVTRYAVMGRSVHDARLAAAMLAHGVPRLLTFDAGDFARYAEIEALDPAVYV